MASGYSGTSGYSGAGPDFSQLGAEEMDKIRAVLAYILIRNTDLHIENIYSLVFRSGSKITWN